METLSNMKKSQKRVGFLISQKEKEDDDEQGHNVKRVMREEHMLTNKPEPKLSRWIDQLSIELSQVIDPVALAIIQRKIALAKLEIAKLKYSPNNEVILAATNALDRATMNLEKELTIKERTKERISKNRESDIDSVAWRKDELTDESQILSMTPNFSHENQRLNEAEVSSPHPTMSKGTFDGIPREMFNPERNMKKVVEDFFETKFPNGLPHSESIKLETVELGENNQHRDAFIQAKVPGVPGMQSIPSMLLYELGNNPEIIKSFSTTSRKVLFGPSGIGKTRAILELACHRFGLYLRLDADPPKTPGSQAFSVTMTRIEQIIKNDYNGDMLLPEVDCHQDLRYQRLIKFGLSCVIVAYITILKKWHGISPKAFLLAQLYPKAYFNGQDPFCCLALELFQCEMDSVINHAMFSKAFVALDDAQLSMARLPGNFQSPWPTPTFTFYDWQRNPLVECSLFAALYESLRFLDAPSIISGTGATMQAVARTHGSDMHEPTSPLDRDLQTPYHYVSEEELRLDLKRLFPNELDDEVTHVSKWLRGRYGFGRSLIQIAAEQNLTLSIALKQILDFELSASDGQSTYANILRLAKVGVDLPKNPGWLIPRLFTQVPNPLTEILIASHFQEQGISIVIKNPYAVEFGLAGVKQFWRYCIADEPIVLEACRMFRWLHMPSFLPAVLQQARDYLIANGKEHFEYDPVDAILPLLFNAEVNLEDNMLLAIPDSRDRRRKPFFFPDSLKGKWQIPPSRYGRLAESTSKVSEFYEWVHNVLDNREGIIAMGRLKALPVPVIFSDAFLGLKAVAVVINREQGKLAFVSVQRPKATLFHHRKGYRCSPEVIKECAQAYERFLKRIQQEKIPFFRLSVVELKDDVKYPQTRLVPSLYSETEHDVEIFLKKGHVANINEHRDMFGQKLEDDDLGNGSEYRDMITFFEELETMEREVNLNNEGDYGGMISSFKKLKDEKLNRGW